MFSHWVSVANEPDDELQYGDEGFGSGGESYGDDMSDNDYGDDDGDDCGNECEDPAMKEAIKASMGMDGLEGQDYENMSNESFGEPANEDAILLAETTELLA